MSKRSKAIALNTLTSYIRFIFSFLVMFFLVPFIIGNLGEADYGLWALIFSILSLAELLDLGFATAVVKYVAHCKGAEDPQERNRIISTLSVVYLCLSGCAALIIGTVAYSFDWIFSIPLAEQGKAVTLLWILAGRLICISLPLGIFRSVLFGEQKIAHLNVIQILSTCLYGSGAFWILSSGGSLIDLALVNVGSMLLEYMVYVILVIKLVDNFKISWSLVDLNTLKSVSSFSAAQFLTDIAGLILLKTDLILIKIFMSLSAVAIYAIALNITTQLHLLVKQFINIFISYIAELHGKGNKEKIRWLLVTGTRMALVPGVIIVASVYVYASDAVNFWVGPDFHQAVPLLYILVTAMLCGVPQMVAAGILSMTGHHAFTSRTAGLSAISNVILSLLFIPYFGLIGVAVATILARVCIDLFLFTRKALAQYKIQLDFYLKNGILPALQPSIPQIIILRTLRYVLPPNNLLEIALQCSVGGLVYLITYAKFFMSSEEKLKAGNKFQFLKRFL